MQVSQPILLAFLAVCQHGAEALFQDAPSVVDAMLREDNVDQIAQQAAALYQGYQPASQGAATAQFSGQPYANPYTNEVIPPLVGQPLDDAILAAAPQGFDDILSQPSALEPSIAANTAMQAAIDMFNVGPPGSNLNVNMMNSQQRGIDVDEKN